MTAVLAPPAVGLSSACLPRASVSELAAVTLAAGGTAVDLRLGKGHAWEAGDWHANVRAFEQAGVTVAFVGITAVLGAQWQAGDVILPPGAATVPVKVFCAQDPDDGVLAAQAARARERGHVLWVETHRGGPDVPRLTRLCARHGFGLVLDSLGACEVGGGSPSQTPGEEAVAALAPYVRAVQVKGVETTPAGRRHRPLRASDLEWLPTLRTAGSRPLAITVESKAGSPSRDLRVLAEATAAVWG